MHSAHVHISIKDALGRELYTEDLSSTGEVTSLHVATGVYIGTLLADGLKVGQTRMVVQH